jgi:hypothetical protein
MVAASHLSRTETAARTGEVEGEAGNQGEEGG